MFPTSLLPPATEIHFWFLYLFSQEFTHRRLIHCQIWKRKTSNTEAKLGHRQGVRRLDGQFWVQRGIPTTLQLEWGPGTPTFPSSSMGFSEVGACSFPDHCPGPERKQETREAWGHRARTARPGHWDPAFAFLVHTLLVGWGCVWGVHAREPHLTWSAHTSKEEALTYVEGGWPLQAEFWPVMPSQNTEENEDLLNMFSFYIVEIVLSLHFTRNIKSTHIH